MRDRTGQCWAFVGECFIVVHTKRIDNPFSGEWGCNHVCLYTDADGNCGVFVNTEWEYSRYEDDPDMRSVG